MERTLNISLLYYILADVTLQLKYCINEVFASPHILDIMCKSFKNTTSIKLYKYI